MQLNNDQTDVWKPIYEYLYLYVCYSNYNFISNW